MHSPKLWATVYLLLIPTFAVLYLSRAGDFYQSSAASRPSAAFSNEARLQVEDSIRSWFTGQTGGQILTLPDGSKIDIGDLWITRVSRSESDLVFDFSALQCNGDGADCAIRQFAGTVPPDITSVHTRDSTWFVRRVILEPAANDLAGAFPGSAEMPSPALGLSAEASSVLTAYSEAGQPTLPQIGRTFERMLYLSSITITTVGYGDVVPITFISRVLVASEALLGIVVAGLFLNTIAQNVSRRPAAPAGNEPTDATPRDG